jgi:Protein of unknown function (DUF2971)
LRRKVARDIPLARGITVTGICQFEICPVDAGHAGRFGGSGAIGQDPRSPFGASIRADDLFRTARGCAWLELLMWSHYGDSHTGLCFGFDIPDGPYDMYVRYQPNLLKIRRPEDMNFDLVNRLLRTKRESWSYEQEVRTLVDISNEPRDDNGFLSVCNLIRQTNRDYFAPIRGAPSAPPYARMRK